MYVLALIRKYVLVESPPIRSLPYYVRTLMSSFWGGWADRRGEGEREKKEEKTDEFLIL